MIWYEKIFNESLLKKFESAQYNAALAITGTIRGTNNVKLSGIGFRVQNRRKLRRWSLLYKTYKDQSLLYLYNVILAITSGRITQWEMSKKSFPATITGWIDLDYSLSNAPSINVFKQNILKFILLGPNNIHNLYGQKLLTRLRLV